MRRIRVGSKILVSAIMLSVPGCTWVSLEPGAEEVRVLPSDAAAECQKLSTLRAKTSEKVLFFSRGEKKMLEELEALARNEAAAKGANAIVPVGEVEAGRRSFDVYRCPD